jgi:prepilin-type N-terminal cleavage/methylation domain-containing protein
MKYASYRGFTLIELLVVVAIIGLLSSIVLAALQTARLKAKDAAYAEELSQLHTALMEYKLGHNDQVPVCPSPSSIIGASALTCFDLGGFGWLDEALAPLIAEGDISKIPHYPSRSSINSTTWAYATYRPNIYNVTGVLATEYSCGTMSYADWRPHSGQMPGMLLIVTTETLPFHLGFTMCDTAAGQCFVETQPVGYHLYCISLDFS